nr:phage tail tape measure protein [Brevibacterium sp. 91QC2O2]
MMLDATGVETGAQKASAAIQKIHGTATTSKKYLSGLEKSAKNHAQAWQSTGTAVAGFGTGVVVSLGMATKAAMGWESAFAGVKKTVNGTPEELDEIQKSLRNLAATKLPASHQEIAAVAEAAGQLGIQTGNITSFTKTMIDMGEATNLSADEAATSLSRFMNIMGTSQTDVGRLGASIVGLGNNFATTESEIMDMAMRIAGAGQQAHMSEGDVLGMAAALSSVGIEAEAGGTAISTTMKRMGNSVAEGGDDLAMLANVAGMSSDQFQQAWGENSAGTMQKFVAGLGKAQDKGENVNKVLSDLGITGIRESDALLRLSASAGTMQDALATGNEEYAKGIALIQEAEKRYATAESRVKIAGNSIKDAAINFGDVLLPVVADAADGVAGLAQWFAKLPDPVKNATVGIAGIGGTAAIAAGGFLTLAPKVFDTIDEFKELTKVHPKVASGLSKVGKMAGYAAIGLATAQVAAAAMGSVIDSTSRSSDEMTRRLVAMQKAGTKSTGGGVLDPEIWKEANGYWVNGGDAIDNWGKAIEASDNKVGKFLDTIMGTRTSATIVSDTIESTDQALTNLAQGGAMDTAADGFLKIAQQAEANGTSLDDLFKKFPEYKSYLESVATAAGYTTDEQTLLQIATGEISQDMLEAGSSSDEQAKKLQTLGVQAKTTEDQIKDLADEIRGFGKATLDERKATRDFEKAIDDARDSLKENGKTLDDNTEAGRKNGDALDTLAKSANDSAAAILENGGSADELEKKMKSSRKRIIETAESFGMSKSEAKKYADQVMMTPEEVKTRVKTEGTEKSGKKITGVQKKADKLDKTRPKVYVDSDTSKAKSKIDGILDWVESLPLMKIPVTVVRKYVDGGAETATTPKNPDTGRAYQKNQWASYYGGLVKPMADGGFLSPMDDTAAMVKPGTWRVVGDRMDVDEAYVPLDGSPRSWKILMEALKRMPGAAGRFMARGGVVSAQKSVDSLQKQLTSARRHKSDAKKSDKAEWTRRVRSLEDDLRDAKARLKGAKSDAAAAKKAAAEAKKKAQEAKERRQRVGELRTDARTDIRRGDFREQVTGGLSGAYSAVDRLRDLSKNSDLSKRQRRIAGASTSSYERTAKRLYGQMDKLDKRVEKAKSKLDELKSIQDSVSSSIQGNAYKLDVSETWTQGKGGKWSHAAGVKGAVTNARAAANRVKDLAGKITKLQRMGYSGAILQEVTGQGSVEESLAVANELLKGSKADVKSLNSSYKTIETYSNRTGADVTKSFYKGGVNAAAGLVKGLESDQKSVDKAIKKLAKRMEKTLKKSLGIHSPSTVIRDVTRWVPAGAALGVEDGIPAVQTATQKLAAALVPDVTRRTLPIGLDTDSLSGLMRGPQTIQPVQRPTGAQEDDQDAHTGALAAPQAQTDEDAAKAAAETLAGMQQVNADAYQKMAADQAKNLDAQTEKSKKSSKALTDGQASMLDQMAKTQSKRYRDIGKDTASKLDDQKDRSKRAHTSIRDTADNLTQSMRRQQNRTYKGMGSDQSNRLDSMKRTAKSGFGRIEDTGVAAFRGIRSGMNSELAKARPNAGAKLNSVIGIMGKFAGSVNKAFSEVGVKLSAPAKLKYATGTAGVGVVPGYTPGRDVHTYYSPTGGILELSGGEPVLRPEAGAVLGPQWVDGINAAAIHGGRPGVQKFLDLPHEKYATGGIKKNTAGLVQLGKLLNGLGVRASEGPAPFGPVHRVHAPNSWHYRQGALDLNTAPGQSAKEMRDFDRIMPLLYKLGWGVIWRWTGHYNHAHVDLGNRSLGSFNRNPDVSGDLWEKLRGMKVGAAVGGGGYGMEPITPKFLTDAGIKSVTGDVKKTYAKAAEFHLKKAKATVAGQIADLPGMYGDLANGIISKMGAGLTKKAQAWGKSNDLSGGGNFKASASMEYWRPLVAKALAYTKVGGGRADEDRWLRQIMSESSGNPKLIQSRAVWDANWKRGDPARGLVQVPGVTWADFGKGLGPFIPNVYDPYKNLITGMRQAAHDYHPWQAAIGRGHGYEGGTKSAIPGYAWVGERGPELRKLRGGDQIVPNRQAVSVENQVLRTQQTLALSPDSLTQLQATIAGSQNTSPQALAAALQGVQMTLMVDGRQMAAHITAVVDHGVRDTRSSIAQGSRLVGAR